MAKITKDEKKLLTRDEAIALVRNVDGRVRFGVHVHAWLPTTENRGFDSSTALTVSRTDMIKVIANVASEPYMDKGAKVELHLIPAEPDRKYSVAWVWLS